MKRVKLSQIASALDLVLCGDGEVEVMGLAEPKEAGPTHLALATKPNYAAGLRDGLARAALLWPEADWTSYGLKAALLPQRPRYAMSGLTAMMDPGQAFGVGIHPSAIIDPTARIGPEVHIGPFSVIGPNAQIGAGSVIGPHVSVGAHAVLGERAYLREHVSIAARVRIGARFIAQPGARIGADGFSFVTETKSSAEAARETLGKGTDDMQSGAQPWHRIHSLGAVVIGDDVEIGANSCIDSGTIRPTEIGRGTKIDNLAHIAHNVRIGMHCLICGHVGIAGSAVIGDHVVLGGQVGVNDNIVIGDNVIAGGASAIFSNVPKGRIVLGSPATRMDAQIESYKAFRRLPRLMRDFATLKKAVSNLPGSD